MIYTITQLWFDVEERYNTTHGVLKLCLLMLWFDVEERYNTTVCVMSC